MKGNKDYRVKVDTEERCGCGADDRYEYHRRSCPRYVPAWVKQSVRRDGSPIVAIKEMN